MNKLGAQSSNFKGFALVRDKNGVPRVDDPENLPQEIRDMLTDEEFYNIYLTERKKNG
jgi:hypothetical protein